MVLVSQKRMRMRSTRSLFRAVVRPRASTSSTAAAAATLAPSPVVLHVPSKPSTAVSNARPPGDAIVRTDFKSVNVVSSLGLAPTHPTLRPSSFHVVSSYAPGGDQPAAIAGCIAALQRGDSRVVLRGATGTGKTFVVANVVAALGKPTLLLAPNKTIAAQLVRELRSYLPAAAVHLFVSSFDFFIPEAFNEAKSTYMEKTSKVNPTIEALRHRATRALAERSDVVIVASVSALYGLGLPNEYLAARVVLAAGEPANRAEVVRRLSAALYRTTSASSSGEEEPASSRRQGGGGGSLVEVPRGALILSPPDADSASGRITIWPPDEETPLVVDIFGGVVRSLRPHADEENGGAGLGPCKGRVTIFPARHFVLPAEELARAVRDIRAELVAAAEALRENGNEVAASRLEARTEHDLKLLASQGWCAGVENYSRHLTGRSPGAPPSTLVAYFAAAAGANGFFVIADESHVVVPQCGAMAAGDASRKAPLVTHGFRLPSAADNRPLTGDELWASCPSVLFVSATPGHFEIASQPGGRSQPPAGEMVNRPTGVLDPAVEVRPMAGHLPDLLAELRGCVARNERALVVATSKREAEDVAEYLVSRGINAGWLHSGVDSPGRAARLAALQAGDIDVLVGVALLREGLDLPQVSRVLILDADRRGFLRSTTALVQTMGRAARHVAGRCVLYAHGVSPAMGDAMGLVAGRRASQAAFNAEHGVVPRSARSAPSSAPQASPFDELEGEAEAAARAAGAWRDAAASHAAADGVDTVRLADGDDDVDDVLPLLARREEPPKSRPRRRVTPSSAGGVETVEGAAARVAALRAAVARLPRRAGCYLFLSDTSPASPSNTLYVGKATNLRARASSYFSPSSASARPGVIEQLLASAVSVEVVVTPSGERDALLLEARLVALLSPPLNARLRHDAAAPYVVVDVPPPLPDDGGAGGGDDAFDAATWWKRGRRGGGASAALLRIEYDTSVAAPISSSGWTAARFGPFPIPGEAGALVGRLTAALRLRPLAVSARAGERSGAASLRLATLRCVDALSGRGHEVASALEAVGHAADADAVRTLFKPTSGEARPLEAAQRAGWLDAWLVKPQRGGDGLLGQTRADDTDVAAFARTGPDAGVVHILQLRSGLGVAGRSSLGVEVARSTGGDESDAAADDATSAALHSHYAASQERSFPTRLVVARPLQEGARQSLALLLRIPPSSVVAPSPSTSSDSAAPLFASPSDDALARLAAANAAAAADTAAAVSDEGAVRVAALRDLLRLPPECGDTLEAIDISHMSGSHTHGACVAFSRGAPDARFHKAWPLDPLRAGASPSDDPWAIGETVRLRCAAADKGRPLPTVLLIDGGQTQLATAAAALAAHGRGVAVVLLAIAKVEETVRRAAPLRGGAFAFEVLPTRRDSPDMLLLRAARDEAHTVCGNFMRAAMRRAALRG